MRPCLGGLVIPYTCNSGSRYTLSLKVPRMLSLKTKDRTGGGGVLGDNSPPPHFLCEIKKKSLPKIVSYIHVRE